MVLNTETTFWKENLLWTLKMMTKPISFRSTSKARNNVIIYWTSWKVTHAYFVLVNSDTWSKRSNKTTEKRSGPVMCKKCIFKRLEENIHFLVRYRTRLSLLVPITLFCVLSYWITYFISCGLGTGLLFLTRVSFLIYCRNNLTFIEFPPIILSVNENLF